MPPLFLFWILNTERVSRKWRKGGFIAFSVDMDGVDCCRRCVIVKRCEALAHDSTAHSPSSLEGNLAEWCVALAFISAHGLNTPSAELPPLSRGEFGWVLLHNREFGIIFIPLQAGGARGG